MRKIPELQKNKLRLFAIFLIGCILIVVLIFLLGLLSYKPVYRPAQIHWPFSSSSVLNKINTMNAKNIKQVSAFIQSSNNGPPFKVAFSLNGCCVLAIYQSGLLQKWDIEKDTLIATYQLGTADPRAVNFSVDGSRVVTSRQVLDSGKILGVTIWNTATGKNIFCEGDATECPDGQNWDEQNGFFLDPSGKWLFGYSLQKNEYVEYQYSNLDIQNIEDPSIGSIASGIYLDEKIYMHDPNAEVAMITTDINTQYIAYAFSNGLVRAETIDYLDPDRPPYHFDYVDGIKETKIDVVDLAMDNTRTWLAELRDDELLVWNMQRGIIFPLVLRVPISNGTALAFNPAGEILAVATNTEIRFYDLNWGTVAGSISTKGTSTLTFSRDNRMLISGDSTGNVYVWGIP